MIRHLCGLVGGKALAPTPTPLRYLWGGLVPRSFGFGSHAHLANRLCAPKSLYELATTPTWWLNRCAGEFRKERGWFGVGRLIAGGAPNS